MVRRLAKGTFSRLLALLRWLARQDIALLVAVALVAGGAWLFVVIADEVAEGGTASLDRRILLAMRDARDPAHTLGPPWVGEAARDFTAMGGVSVIAFVTLATTRALLMQRKRHAAVLVLVAVCGGALLDAVLKSAFSRPRPDLVPHGSWVSNPSFPSGHSMISAVTYLTLGALLARLEPGKRTKIYFLGLACVLTFLVGLSRVYLGVHWPTDVLAGWTAGAVWALLCWLVARRLQQRGQVESDMSPTPDG